MRHVNVNWRLRVDLGLFDRSFQVPAYVCSNAAMASYRSDSCTCQQSVNIVSIPFFFLLLCSRRTDESVSPIDLVDFDSSSLSIFLPTLKCNITISLCNYRLWKCFTLENKLLNFSTKTFWFGWCFDFLSSTKSNMCSFVEPIARASEQARER